MTIKNQLADTLTGQEEVVFMCNEKEFEFYSGNNIDCFARMNRKAFEKGIIEMSEGELLTYQSCLERQIFDMKATLDNGYRCGDMMFFHLSFMEYCHNSINAHLGGLRGALVDGSLIVRC